MVEEQHKRPSLALGGESQSSKKIKVRSLSSSSSTPMSTGVVKSEPEEGQVVQGGRAPRARAAVAEQERERRNFSLEVHLFHCDVAGCQSHLRPPVFMCEAGHLLCDTCRGEGRHCRCCNRDASFVPCPVANRFVGGARVPCPYEAAGCNSSVAYHDILAHRDACAYAPCNCLVPGCTVAASPPLLRDHLVVDHSWSVHRLLSYSKAHELRVPAEDSQRLLVVVGDEPRMFLLSLRRAGEPIAVSVACLRASAATEGPHFKCSLWAEAPTPPDAPRLAPRRLMMETEVPNCALLPGGPALEPLPWLYMGPEMLSRDVVLRIRIDEVRRAPSAALSAGSPR